MGDQFQKPASKKTTTVVVVVIVLVLGLAWAGWEIFGKFKPGPPTPEQVRRSIWKFLAQQTKGKPFKPPLDLSAASVAGPASVVTVTTDADGRNAPAAFFLGWAFHGAGDDRQAISAWRRAAFIDPTIVPVHLALADIYQRLSQPALAIQALHAGLAALPQSPELLDRLSRIERHQ